MAAYSAELLAAVRHDYEGTDKSLARIAIDHAVSERTINRWRDRDGWARRSERLRDLPPAMRALQEATALLVARPPAVAANDDAADVGWAKRSVPTTSVPADGTTWARREAASLPTLPETAPSPIERIERLVEKELSAEEAARAQLGPLARVPADAERSARTLATLTQTLQALARLRCGLPPDGGFDDDDDMPRDIDEFRRDLARRIDAFVASRTEPRHAQGDSGPAQVDEGR